MNIGPLENIRRDEKNKYKKYKNEYPELDPN